MQLEVLAKDARDFQKTLVGIRNALGQRLSDFELLSVFDEHVNEMFPGMIEKELLENFK